MVLAVLAMVPVLILGFAAVIASIAMMLAVTIMGVLILSARLIMINKLGRKALERNLFRSAVVKRGR